MVRAAECLSVLDELAGELRGQVKFSKVNVDEEPDWRASLEL